MLGELPPFPLEVYDRNPDGVSVETFLTGLDVVWGLEFAPDGRLFISEKAGRIRVVSDDGELDATPWATVDILDEETRERGLFGLALHPNFDEQPWVYVMYTYDKDQDWRGNRVSRFREENGRGVDEEIIIDGLPGAMTHNGGRITLANTRVAKLFSSV